MKYTQRPISGHCRRPRMRELDSGRDGQHAAIVCMHDLPSALMHHPVMAVTEKDEVVEIGGAAMDPVHDVMCGAPLRRPVAARPPAVTVARLQRLAPGTGDDPLRAPDI